MNAFLGASLAFLLSGTAGAQPVGPAAGPEELPFTAEELIRKVAVAQGRVDRSRIEADRDRAIDRIRRGEK